MEVLLAPQVLVNCGGGGSCEGGDPGAAYEYIAEEGIPDETCQNYEAVDGECSPYGVCETCTPGQDPEPFLPGTCTAVTDYTQYTIEEYGHVVPPKGPTPDLTGSFPSQKATIKSAIYADGPVSCGIHVTDKFEKYSGGIFSEFSIAPELAINHELALVGWGSEGGEDYWIGRNSWGTYWGEDGFFRIKMDSENLGVASDCSWATPSAVKRTAGAERVSPAKAMESKAKAPRAAASPKTKTTKFSGKGLHHDFDEPCLKRADGAPKSVVKTAVPQYDAATTPDSWDIRNVDGVSYASRNVNQHIPQYCGSCWTQGTTSALADRFMLAQGKALGGTNAFPEVELAAQVLVDCVSANQSNGCSGGDPTAAYSWVYENGQTDATCSPYTAKDGDCSDLHKCANCDPRKGCFVQTPKRVFHISEHGQVRGEEAMMAEIAARGSIGCGLCVTPEFDAYTGGIFNDTSGCKEQDHEISITGYGVTDDGIKYWIGRNSWGEYWGERGWFRIVRGTDNLGVEDACDWAVPDLSDWDLLPKAASA